MEGARDFGDWISGAKSARVRDVGLPTATATRTSVTQSAGELPGSSPQPSRLPHISGNSVNSSLGDREMGVRFPDESFPTANDGGQGYPPPPEGFWEPENPPYEDRSARSEPQSSSDTGFNVEGSYATNAEPSSLTIELLTPNKILLDLTKTTMAVWSHNPAGGMPKIFTHTYVIVTTTPGHRSKVLGNNSIQSKPQNTSSQSMNGPDSGNTLNIERRVLSDMPITQSARPPRISVLPSRTASLRGISSLPVGAGYGGDRSSLTPTEELTALDLSIPSDTTNRAPQPVYFNRDGTVTRHTPGQGGPDPNKRSLSAHDLLQRTNWAATALGPRKEWPQSLKTMGEPVRPDTFRY